MATPWFLMRLRSGAASFLDALLPPRCLLCHQAVGASGGLCAPCWRRIAFLDGPCCAHCGLPFPHAAEEGTLCAACIGRAPAYDRARAVMAYDDASRGLVLALKHGDRHEGVRAFGGWMARAGRDLVKDADIVAPVPLHRGRLFSRRFNQAALLARALVTICHLRLVPDLLVRTRPTPSQGGLGAAARRRNVRNAFKVRAGREDIVSGAAILLVDDVFTTGATAEACARTLRQAGAAKVDVMTLARVVRPVLEV